MTGGRTTRVKHEQFGGINLLLSLKIEANAETNKPFVSAFPSGLVWVDRIVPSAARARRGFLFIIFFSFLWGVCVSFADPALRGGRPGPPIAKGPARSHTVRSYRQRISGQTDNGGFSVPNSIERATPDWIVFSSSLWGHGREIRDAYAAAPHTRRFRCAVSSTSKFDRPPTTCDVQRHHAARQGRRFTRTLAGSVSCEPLLSA